MYQQQCAHFISMRETTVSKKCQFVARDVDVLRVKYTNLPPYLSIMVSYGSYTHSLYSDIVLDGSVHEYRFQGHA